MGSRFKKRGVGSIEADERGGAEAGAAGEVDCFDVGGLHRVSIGRLQRRYLIRSDERRCRRPVIMSPSQNRLPGKRVSAGLLQHGKRVLEWQNNVQKGQGLLVFVAVQDVAIQSFGKKTLKSMSASALMLINCCQRACETIASKATPIMIRWKRWCRPGVPFWLTRRDNQ